MMDKNMLANLMICTEDEYNRWQQGELLFNYIRGYFIAIKLSDNEKMQAREYYNEYKSIYWKDWEQLSKKEIESWYIKYAKDRMSDYKNTKTYYEYWLGGFPEVRHYTSPSGDRIIIFEKCN